MKSIFEIRSNLKKRIAAFVWKFRNSNRFDFESVTWLKRNWDTWPSTIRKNVDYDDAWYHVMASESVAIMDVGAHIGYTALLAFSTNDNIQILLVDPNPEALGVAAINMFRNGLSDRCQFECCFLSDVEGKRIKFYTVGSGSAGSIFPEHAVTARYAGSFQFIKTSTLDEICDQRDFKPDLIKLDVEGAEYQVLVGSSTTARASKPKIFIEMHSTPEMSMQSNTNDVLDWCKMHDYKAWYLKEHCELVDPSVVSHRGRCHLLLLPADTDYPESLRGIDQGSEIQI